MFESFSSNAMLLKGGQALELEGNYSDLTANSFSRKMLAVSKIRRRWSSKFSLHSRTNLILGYSNVTITAGLRQFRPCIDDTVVDTGVCYDSFIL